MKTILSDPTGFETSTQKENNPISRRCFRPNSTYKRSAAKRPNRELVVYWYTKIKEIDPDWVDIEQSVDLNEFHGSTFKTTAMSDGRWPSTSVFLLSTFAANAIPFADSIEATQWRRVANHAWDLPRDYPHIDFILSVCETGIVFTGIKVTVDGKIVTRNRFGMTKRSAYKIWKDFYSSLDDNRDD